MKKEAEESGRKKIQKNNHEPRNQLEIQTKQLTLIQPLDSKDCAFDSNDELDLNDSERESLEKGKASQEKKDQSQQEEEEELKNIYLTTLKPSELILDNKDGELEKEKNEQNGLECHKQLLLASELDELNSSFSTDDWPSLGGDPDCENPL